MPNQCDSAGGPGPEPAERRTPESGAQPAPDLDLDRLVWDPEYREEVRVALRPGR